MHDLTGKVGELRFVIEVTRKDTGAVEHYDMVGHILPDENDGKPVEPKKDAD